MITPISLNERGPTETDCDDDGNCWIFNPGSPGLSNPHTSVSSWKYTSRHYGTHWLPYDALPIPTSNLPS